jgi:hypothetical protein
MKQTIRQIKLGEVSETIQHLGIDRATMINLTIETIEESILTTFDRIAKDAQDRGLTPEILVELLADES